ncbi:MAG TPA: class I SAM-dependent methyltransferase [Solirubrobacteraceae bacterium]|nr:class I SAM-dependent methyltransferase [Solirubrobacteraceae bacterium]
MGEAGAMATMQTACRVCDGDLSLRIAGTNGHAPVAEAFAPSRHETGRHGDLLTCIECGTVQQPLLPGGDELHELYRDMSDDAYLGEEAGRRATAGHLLDLVGAQVASGRLLDVGCGHGLLLDEARSRGYETVGLELSRSAARHAREGLGLDVHEQPIESFVDLDGFDVVVLADVIEHLDDPVDGIARAAPRSCAPAACCAS